MRHFLPFGLLLLTLAVAAQSRPSPTDPTANTAAAIGNPKSSGQSDKLPKPFDLGEMLLIISICGLIGGYTNFRRTVEQLPTAVPNSVTIPSDSTNPTLQPATKEERNRYLMTCLTAGLVAAALVPLFLNSLSSKLLNERTDLNLMIFAGFCLLAGVASNSFIDALTQRILNQIKSLHQKTEDNANRSEANRLETENLLESTRIEAESIRTK